MKSVTKTSGETQCYYCVSTAAVWRLTLIYWGEEMEMQPEIFILRQTIGTPPDPSSNKQHLFCRTKSSGAPVLTADIVQELPRIAEALVKKVIKANFIYCTVCLYFKAKSIM